MGRGLTGVLAAALAATIGDIGAQMDRAARVTDYWAGMLSGRRGGRHRVARELAAKARIAKRRAKRKGLPIKRAGKGGAA